ncbi:DNA sulfur modification protein DndB [Okeania sp.]|uniref:DNA sulfur modification protein DndB n=1 Tax=Okeania sp. TaxID=3100323 RepID=UPI002B4B17A0|nr:DNA sulfur modification protein DndB [Okeania sp.]MEB3342042.1 DNA sulfur modification protein DndB [Okeania sp.]
MVPVPSIKGKYGSKLYVFQTTVKPLEIHNLLGHDPRSKNWSKLQPDLRELYENLQRKTDANRSRTTAEYIKKRIASDRSEDMVGAFPAISIGMVNVPVFQSYDETGKDIDSAIGYLKFDLSARNIRVLLDGLARVTGALDLIEEGETEVVNSFTFPVTIYAPTEKTGDLTVEQLGQIFHDFNFLATPVSKSLAVALDQSDLYIALTKAIAETPVIESRGGMEKNATRVTKKSGAFVAQQCLLKFIRGACEGYNFQKSNSKTIRGKRYLNSETFADVKISIEDYLETLATLMGENFENKDYIHHTYPGWCALGLIFYDLEMLLKNRLTDSEKEDILKKIATIDWSRYNPNWDNMLGNMTQQPDGKKKLVKSSGGGASVTDLANYIRKKTGLDEKLKLHSNTQTELNFNQE